jgi:hypothetical protein
MNDHLKPARLKLKWLNLCVPFLPNSLLLPVQNIGLGALVLNRNIIDLADLNLAHPELIEMP